jgi:hypothetical protein
MKRLVIVLASAALLSGCETLLNVPIGPADDDPYSRYDKSVDSHTVRDCLSWKDEQSNDPNCFYQNRERKDAEEHEPPPPYGRTQ